MTALEVFVTGEKEFYDELEQKEFFLWIEENPKKSLIDFDLHLEKLSAK